MSPYEKIKRFGHGDLFDKERIGIVVPERSDDLLYSVKQLLYCETPPAEREALGNPLEGGICYSSNPN